MICAICNHTMSLSLLKKVYSEDETYPAKTKFFPFHATAPGEYGLRGG